MNSGFKNTMGKVWDVLYPFVFCILCLVCVTMAAIIIGAVFLGAASSELLIAKYPAVSILINIVFYAIIILTQTKNYKKDRMRFGRVGNRWPAFAFAVLAALGVGIALSVNYLLIKSPLPEMFPGYYEGASGTFAGQSPFLLIPAVVILGPVAEEIIFRGMTLDRIKNYLGTPAAIIISSLLFGAYHANMVQFIYASLIGILLGIYYEKSGSLTLPILTHMAMNAFLVVPYVFS